MAFSAPPSNAPLVTERAPVSTGSAAIDALLDGGLDRAALTQVYGPPAAGKSTLAMSSAVAVAASGSTAVYLDTEGLSLDRLEQIAAARLDEPTAALDRIMVTRATSFDEQADRLREAAAVADRSALIAVDSVTAQYRIAQAEPDDDGEALDRLTNQVAFLLSLARRHDLAVLLTNQVFTDPDDEVIRPLGGDALAHWSSTIARIDRFRGSRRRLSLEKHGSEPAEDAIMLDIVDAGFAGLDVSPP